VELTADQKKMMGDLKRDLVITIKAGTVITAAHEAALRTKFLQISAGAIYDHDHKAHAIDAKARVEEIRSVVEQAPGKILIFASFTSVVNMLHAMLKKDWTCEVVNGSTSPKERARIFQAFQSTDEPRILLADPGTMAHGLDLWQAQTVVWATPVDKTELYLQANRRAHRPGQLFPVTIVQIVSNNLEREIYRRLETNTSLQGALLDAVRRDEL